MCVSLLCKSKYIYDTAVAVKMAMLELGGEYTLYTAYDNITDKL